MARPRVFISSTFYDLQHIRTSLEGFVERLGYEAVLSEKGRIAYDPDIPLDKSCYRESASCDIFVLILGGRYGSAASGEDIASRTDFYERYQSITKKEYDSACSRDVPIYILVERSVFSEYEIYKKNKDNESINYAHVDSINIFQLLEKILGKSRNNPVFQFDRHTEIEDWLREQWAGLFRELISRRSEQKQLSSLSERITELSSINSSLQRYMETIVSSVSSSPEEAKQIISEEKERLNREKAHREFNNILVVRQLWDIFDISKSTTEEVYRKASSIENLACRIEAESNELSADEIIKFWREKPEIVDDINKARSLLGELPLKYESNKKMST
ncbi:MAG: DUF4062 domain-containing protein [Candidatus Aminicenantes bacterium]|nr:DUF4062 domain-containing protein [Candidatus Aminicenantes bacterium]